MGQEWDHHLKNTHSLSVRSQPPGVCGRVVNQTSQYTNNHEKESQLYLGYVSSYPYVW